MEPGEHRVGFAAKYMLLKTEERDSDSYSLTFHFNPADGLANLITLYFPTLCFIPEAKDKFYKKMSATISKISNKEHLYILGDFNTQCRFLA